MSNEEVWVWDSWPLTDEDANQYSVNGQEIIFSLVADRNLVLRRAARVREDRLLLPPGRHPRRRASRERRLDLRRPRLRRGRDRPDLPRPVVQPPDPVVGFGAHLQGRRDQAVLHRRRVLPQRGRQQPQALRPAHRAERRQGARQQERREAAPASTRSPTCSRPTAPTTRPARRTSSSTSATRSPSRTRRTPARPTWSSRATPPCPARSATCTEEDLGYRAGRPVRRDRRAGQRLGRHATRSATSAWRRRRTSELTEWEFLPPDPVGQLRHRPDRASADLHEGRQVLPLHHQPPRHVRERASTVLRASTASSATASAATTSR